MSNKKLIFNHEIPIEIFGECDVSLEILVNDQSMFKKNYNANNVHNEVIQFKKEYPDLYDTVETVAHMRSSEQVGQLEEQLKVIKQREAEIIKREAESDLLADGQHVPGQLRRAPKRIRLLFKLSRVA